MNKYVYNKKAAVLFTVFSAIVSYLAASRLFSDFKSLNTHFYIRLIIPAAVIWICGFFSFKTILCLSSIQKKYRIYYVWGLLIIIVMLAVKLFNAIKFPTIQFDTWQLYDTSRYVFSDFGRMDMMRQHIFNTQYQTAFPPLFPTLMAVLNILFDFGVFSSVIINCLTCFILLYFLMLIGKHFNNVVISLIIATLLFFNPEMISCYRGGSTIPLNILVFCIISYIVIVNAEMFTYRNCFQIALLNGLGIMNRFDYMPIAFLMGFLIIFINKKISIKFITIYYPVLFVCAMPWVIYSRMHFNSFFITDNGRRLINILDTRPSTFFSESDPALTVFDNPGEWLLSSAFRWIGAAKSLYRYVSYYTYIKEMILAAGILIIINSRRILKRIRIKCIIAHINTHRACYILFIVLLAQTGAVIITGYDDVRYHILLPLFIQYILFQAFYKQYYKAIEKYNIHVSPIKTAILILTLCSCIIIPKIETAFIEKTAYQAYELFFKQSEAYSALSLKENTNLYEYLDGEENPRMIIFRGENTLDTPKFAAFCNHVTILSPTNIGTDNSKEFVEYFELNYLYSSNKEIVEIFSDTMSVIPSGVPHLYKLEKV